MPATPLNAKREATPIKRRGFLVLATRAILALNGVLGFGMFLRFMSYPTATESLSEIDLGPASDFPRGSRTVLSQVDAVLLHTETGFQVLSLDCPHLGCRLNSESDGYACPCHGSRFDESGALLRGPAVTPLKRMVVELNEQERLILHLP
jgi:Rieske Fe-S protein